MYPHSNIEIEKIINNDEFKKLISNIIQTYNKIQHSQSFVHYDHDYSLIEQYIEYMKNFTDKFGKIICEDGLDFIIEILSRKKYILPSTFIFEIGKYSPDDHKLEIVRCIVKHFPDKLDKYNTKKILDTIISSQIFIECAEILCNYDSNNIFCNCNRTYNNLLFDKYIERYKQVNKLEKENYELKEQIKQLELHIRFMPHGEGYQEAYENFRLAQTMINQQHETNEEEQVEFYSNT
jgi:hypothetical protein